MSEDDVDVYTIDLTRANSGTFLDAAGDAGFDFYNGAWVTVGRHGIRGKAEVVKLDRWSGLRGSATIGCYHEHGGYAGLCDFDRLVLEDGDDNIWSMEGRPQASEAFEVILRSFKFQE
jgi:hypothetical protein